MPIIRAPKIWIETATRGGSAKAKIVIASAGRCIISVTHISATITGGGPCELQLRVEDDVRMSWSIMVQQPLALCLPHPLEFLDDTVSLEMTGPGAGHRGTINMAGSTEELS